MRKMHKILLNEIVNDPLSVGYGTMTSKAVANSLNDPVRVKVDITLPRPLYNLIDPGEFNSLTGPQKTEVRWLSSIDNNNLDVGPGSFARARLISIFGGTSTTITTIKNALNITTSRAGELNVGLVSELTIVRVRRL